MVNSRLIHGYFMVTAPTRSLATMALGLSKGANIALGLAFVVAALRGCTVLCFFVWSSLVLVAWALTPWGVRPGSLTPWGVILRGGRHVAVLVARPLQAAAALPAWGPAATRFLVAAWTRAEGRVTRGTFGCRLVRGLRSFPSLGSGRVPCIQGYPRVPPGAGAQSGPGGLRRRRARERW